LLVILCLFADTAEGKQIVRANDWLDEVYPPVDVGVTLSPSYVLRECDPTAYRCGLIDWLDSEGLTTDQDEADEDEA
jgi:hypothetical protein